MKEIKARLRLFIEENGGNAAKIARQIGIKPSYLAQILSVRSRGLPASLIVGFAEAGYDVQWLLTGKSTLESSAKERESIVERISDLESKILRMKELTESLERILIKTLKGE